ncbi:MAG TPA: efflux RND transporter periplasmic adaptor subunit [Gemmatimonadales bacterium]|nr:efflux RND transporter periplasmic adaptor subunit [Gemmatimonadales bacterium]
MGVVVATRPRLLACALAAVVPIACGRRGGAGEASDPVVRHGSQLVIPPNSPLRSQVGVDSATVAPVRQEFSATATVEADPAHVAHIVPPLAGRVVKLHVRFGDVVEAGQVLVTLDAPDFAAALADYQRAQSALTQAQRTRDRVVDLHDKGVAAVRDTEQAATDLAQARSEFDRAMARLRTLGVDPTTGSSARTLEIRSPLSGVVSDLAAAEGEFRNDASAPLMTVADLSTVWLTGSVQEKDIHSVARGQAVDAMFAAYPDRPFRGTVSFVGDVLDPDTRTVKVRVALPNEARRFKPGMFASMRFIGQAADGVVVPTAAVVEIRDTTYVYAEVAPWTFEPRPVALGAQLGERTVIRSGVGRGDRIVVRGAVLLQ